MATPQPSGFFSCKPTRNHSSTIWNSWGSCAQRSCKHRKTSCLSGRQVVIENSACEGLQSWTHGANSNHVSFTENMIDGIVMTKACGTGWVKRRERTGLHLPLGLTQTLRRTVLTIYRIRAFNNLLLRCSLKDTSSSVQLHWAPTL